ncbi:MAG: insulinase family protein [Dysgonamonadaceae bacterium]|nr:insulinase family protein [Dysgonamonadaceae bacterium]
MKKLTILLGFILFANFTFAQQIPQMQPLPIDPKIKYGKLENGLTYYIRHNELPKERADFYIAQKVGSILEEDYQNGLAHFLEHMCFNGTKHFPGNNVIKYCESIGVKFGNNLNAYTSYDETVYNISNVPTTRGGIIDSCLLILHDWSHDLLLEDEEIDKERGVIREEMRSYHNASNRMRENILKQIMPENQYAKRNVIGTEDIILNFKPDVLREYYHKWYRPDLQAIIVVGDVDPAEIESKLKATFADIPAPVNPAERVYYAIEDNKEPQVGIAKDKEATSTLLTIAYKHKGLSDEEKSTIIGLLQNFFNRAIAGMSSARIEEITQQANPPFMTAAIRNGSFQYTRTEDALQGMVLISGNEFEKGMKAMVHELQRIDKYGFTASEFDRAKADYVTAFENAAKEVDKRQNGNYANDYASHFTDGGYIPGIEMEFEIIKGVTSQIPVESLNQFVKEMITDTNIVITLTAPDKEGVVVPTKEELLKWYNEARRDEVAAYEDKVSNEPLIAELPKAGKIVSEKKDAIFDATVYTLSNGAKVIVKPTTLKDDQILLSAFSPGGSSLFADSERANANLYSALADLGGLSNFSATDLTKVLAGKKASSDITLSLQYEGISGSSNVRDFETMLQLVYLNFTAARNDEEAALSMIGRLKTSLENQELNPMITLNDSALYIIYADKERHKRVKAADLDKVDYKRIMDFRKDRYADAGDFTFIFVGNIDIEKAKPLFEQYLASLPSTGRKETFRKVNEDYSKGVHSKEFTKKMENPQGVVFDFYWTTFDYTLKDNLEISFLSQILTTIFLEEIREKESGVYSIQASASMDDYPKGQTGLQIVFSTKPGEEVRLNEIAIKEFTKIAENGPAEEYFSKAKEYILKSRKDREQENGFWTSVINAYYKTGYNSYTDYEKTVNSITPADIQKKAAALLKSGNFSKVIMTGVKEE